MAGLFSIEPTSKIDVIRELLGEVNRLLPPSMFVDIKYTEDLGIYCLCLYKNGRFYGQLGVCVSKKQLWRIYERLLAINMILERLQETKAEVNK